MIFSNAQNWEKMPFLTNKEFVFFFYWEILVTKFVDLYSENSWKHVVSSIIVKNLFLICERHLSETLHKRDIPKTLSAATKVNSKALLKVSNVLGKGQIKPKADWRAVDSPKKRTNEFVLFAFLLFTANKTNLFVRFLGESTARQSCFWFYLTFSMY